MTDLPLPHSPQDHHTVPYGDRTYGDLFSDRQLAALETFSGLVGEARERVRDDDHAAAVALYLGITVDRLANRHARLNVWDAGRLTVQHVFLRHTLPMVWDYAEANPLSRSSGGWDGQLGYPTRCLEALA